MLKLMPFLLLLPLCALFAADDTLLFRRQFNSPNTVSSALLVTRDGGKAVKTFDAAEKAAKITIETRPGHIAHTSFFIRSNYRLTAGRKYHLSCQIRSSRKTVLKLLVQQNKPPYQVIGGSDEIALEPGEYRRLEYSFTPIETEEKELRLPELWLGRCPEGTELWIREMALTGPAESAPPLRLGKQPQIPGFPALLELQKELPKPIVSGMRERYSLNGYWEFHPGTGQLNTQSPGGYFRVPGHWRGGIISNYMRDAAGVQIEEYLGRPPAEWTAALYRRSFQVPAELRTRSNHLEFERIAGTGELRVNGHAFTLVPGRNRFDVTGILVYGSENTIEVSLNAPGSPGEVKGGILGYVFLDSQPERNFGRIVLHPHVREKKLDIRFAGAVPNLAGTVEITIRDASDGTPVYSAKHPFSPQITLNFIAPKLWTPNTPNLYYCDAVLTGPNGENLDAASQRFGFREFHIADGKYFLNGQPLLLKLDTGVKGGHWAVDWHSDGEFARREMRMLRKFNLNAIYCYTDEPSSFFDLADEEGILILLFSVLPYKVHQNSDDAAIFADYRQRITAMADDPRFANHPSQIGVLIDVWFSLHFGTLNPEHVGLSEHSGSYPAFSSDGKVEERRFSPLLTAEQLRRKTRLDAVGELFRQTFPQFEIFTGGDGEIGHVYSTHLYHTWGAPEAELRAFFSRWAMRPTLPIFIGETNIPYPGSYYVINDFRGARGSDPLFFENTARLAGNAAYRYGSVYARRPNHDFGPESLQAHRTDHDGGKFYTFYAELYQDALIRYLCGLIPAWRHSGVSGFGMFCYVLEQHFTLAGQKNPAWKPSLPGDPRVPQFVPENTAGGANWGAFDPYGAEPDLRPDLAATPFREVMADLSCVLLGSGDDPYERDHAFFGGETLRKKLAILNDSSKEHEFECFIRLHSGSGATLLEKREVMNVPAFAHPEFPFELKLPTTAVRNDCRLQIELRDRKNGDALHTGMKIELFPAVAMPKFKSELYLCDPEGVLSAALNRLKVPFRKLDSLDQMPEHGILIVGRRALTMLNRVPDFNRHAANGLQLLIMEQESSASVELMKTRTRNVFINAPGHPVFASLTDADFSDWRGSCSLLPAYQVNQRGQRWSDWGNRNMVASLMFRRPSHGNYRSLLVSGFDCFQTPLLEYVGRSGSWIGSQLELTERLESDPVARRLFINLLGYLDTRGTFSGETLFFGTEPGETFRKKMRIQAKRIEQPDAATLAGAANLILAAPDFKLLNRFRFELAEFVHRGGKLFYFQVGSEFSSSALPFALGLERVKMRQARHLPDRPDLLWRSGFGDNDLYFHEERELPVFTDIPGMADAFDPGVIFRYPYGAGSFLFCSVTPECFGDTPAAGKCCRMLSALLASSGVMLENNAQCYAPKNGGAELTLDLSKGDWEFSLDPENRGITESRQTGADGSGRWLSGLIADGLEVGVGIPFELFLRREYDGYAWYRLNFEVRNTVPEGTIHFEAGAIDDCDEVWLNGVKIGSTGRETPLHYQARRSYQIPAGLLRTGRNLLVIRVFDEKGEGGIVKLPVRISTRTPTGGAAAWETPYPAGSKRDYNYPADLIRGY